MSGNRTLFWAISGICQLRCRYCFYETGLNQRPSGWVTADHKEEFLQKLATIFQRVVFTGGEPLLNPSFWELVAATRQAGLEVGFLTDGVRMNAECVERVRQYEVSRVMISLDSLNSEVNEAIRQPNRAELGITEQIIQNIKLLTNNRPADLEIVVLETICRSTIDSIEPMSRFCREIGIDLLLHPAGMPLIGSSVSDIRLEACSTDEMVRLERSMLSWATGHNKRTRYTRLAMDMIRGNQPPSNAVCPMGDRYFFLDVDGTLSPCFHRMDIRLGNIYETDPLDIVARGIPTPTDLRSAPCASLACACMLEFNET